MSIKHHILDDEEVLEHCSTDYWTWVCTDRRVLKYKQGKKGREELHDVSFRDISGISLITEPKNTFHLIAGVIGLSFALIMTAFGLRNPIVLLLDLLFIPISALLIWSWYNSGKSFFEFKGRGVIQQEPEKWRINIGVDESPKDIQEFVKTVRSRLQ